MMSAWDNDDIDPQEMIELLVCFHLAAPVETEFMIAESSSIFYQQFYQDTCTGQPNETPPGNSINTGVAGRWHLSNV